jgi:hypothetical protein
MKHFVRGCIGLLLLTLSVCAQPALVVPQNQSLAGSTLSNLRLLKQSDDGTEAVLTVDFIYDGLHGPPARVLPLIIENKEPKVSSWFGADPVSISAGAGTVSLKVKFFNDEPGVPQELTTDHVRIMIFSDGGDAVIGQGIFSTTIKGGSQKTGGADAQRLAPDRGTAANHRQTAPTNKAAFAIASKVRTHVTNFELVNRSLDRTETTIAVAFKYAKDDGPARVGVELTSTNEPDVSDYFSCPVMNIGKAARNVVMFPVRLNVAAAQSVKRATLSTDKVRIFLAGASGQKSYIYEGNMALVWHIPAGAQADASSGGGDTVEIESFNQNGLFSGSVTVNYNIRTAAGRLRLRVFDFSNPATASWFASDDVPIKSGPGQELLKIAVPKDAGSPDVFSADTVEIQMLDATGAVLATARKQMPTSWMKPK